MSAESARDELAALVASVVPDAWTVYAYEPEVMSLPGAVLVGRSPYRRPGTFCAEIMGVTVNLLIGRSALPDSAREVDTLADLVRDAITAADGIAYESTDLGPMIAPGGVEAYGAVLNLEVYLT